MEIQIPKAESQYIEFKLEELLRLFKRSGAIHYDLVEVERGTVQDTVQFSESGEEFKVVLPLPVQQ